MFHAAYRLLRRVFNTCGVFRTFHLSYPTVYDAHLSEYLDLDVQMWLPMFLWWDRQYKAQKEVPYNYVKPTSLKRMEYVKGELIQIEKKKRQHYRSLVENSNIAEDDAKHIIEEWYGLKEYILDEEHKTMRQLEQDHYCQICMERPNDLIAVPCQHELCARCYHALPDRLECPFCRQPIASTVFQESIYATQEVGVVIGGGPTEPSDAQEI